VGSDQEPRKAEQDHDGEGRTGVATEGDAGRDRRCYQPDTSDDAEDTRVRNEHVLGEGLNEVCTRRPFRFREFVHLVDEFAGSTFSPDGRTLYVNIQASNGMTFAIWGPWEQVGV
jgi:secreted PhoX family phosphatase